ncbi:putative oxidoreductase [Pacificibacter maritimus]|uniref:Putative oxidoreductase n=1 Tax=Pacificibacter maritimus TaxID=762213 RepID=A0A3N4UDC2_9RHOB|nr:DoxX family membrane protein [Pacificibacter maritimus]RPE66435.1 putative oxidoreductase [Pacificibacter maritimus]
MPLRFETILARFLLASLFFGGAAQKLNDPSAAKSLLAGFGLPQFLVWPALIYNFVAAALLVLNRGVAWVARSLALYCILTSAFHFIPNDPWQMTIFVKNWAIAGGLLALASYDVTTHKPSL